jgi:regulatory protein
LAREGYEEGDVERAIRRLSRERYLDDAGLAARFARGGMAHRGLGSRRLRQSLRARGVPGEAAEAGLERALEEVSEASALDGVARRYWRLRRSEEPRRRLRKLLGLLLRRGFPPALVWERLRALWPRWSDALDGLDPIEVEESEEN